MPLHLLGKKSWNVYNKDNIERVKRDEEEARQAQQREERRRHDDEAADRLELLRQKSEPTPVSSKRSRRDSERHDVRSSKLRQHEAHSETAARNGSNVNVAKSGDPLDNISNMRFRDAGGHNKEKPWYSSLESSIKADDIGKDVWGNEDTGRKTRDQHRQVSSDPLLAMRRGVKQLKESEKQKSEWRKERERDLHEVEELAKKERKHRRTHPRDRESDRTRRHHSPDKVRRRSSPDQYHHRHRSRSPKRIH